MGGISGTRRRDRLVGYAHTPIRTGLAGIFFALLLFGGTSVGIAAEQDSPNACGCRQTPAGACYCDRNAKCGCPGECEPKGCEDKRTKALDREIELETNKAKAADHKERPLDSVTAKPAPPPPKVLSPKAQKAVEHRMDATQRRQLARLLDAYMSEHPDARQDTLVQVRSALASSGAER